MKPIADLILLNGHVATLDPKHPEAKEVIIADGRIAGVDNAAEFERGPDTKVIDLRDAGSSPGSTTRICTSFAADSTTTWSCAGTECLAVACACTCCASRRRRTPRPSGSGWWEAGANFSSPSGACPRSRRSMPPRRTRRSSFCISTARALLNPLLSGLSVTPRTRPTRRRRDRCGTRHGNPTGMLVARPNATILYATLAKGPKLPLGISIQFDPALHARAEPLSG